MKIIITAVCFAVLLSGCMTRSLFENREYKENISSILVTADGSKLVFVSDDYHYIFQAPKLLTDTVGAPFYRSVQANFDQFYVSRSDTVTGSFDLIVPVSAPDGDRQAASAAGFACKRIGERELCRATVEMQGKRYAASATLPVGRNHLLNKSYLVYVSADEGAGAKALLTPLTVAADGAILIGGLGLTVVSVTGLSVVCASEPNGCK
ncbi:MAG: hypothetical protein ACKVK5_14930 [Pseudomonadales bacterium]